VPDLVLDSWAILAWLKAEEPAVFFVDELLEAAGSGKGHLIMNVVNVGEVYYIAAKNNGLASADNVLIMLNALVTTVSAPDDLVMEAAMLKARHAISYADAFGAVTAIRLRWPLVTGDTELRRLAEKETRLNVQWIGG
jgi:predicted nucleic acid-binding protein